MFIIIYCGMVSISSYPVFDIIPQRNEQTPRRIERDQINQIEIIVQGDSKSMKHHKYNHEKLRRKRLRKLFQKYLESRKSTNQVSSLT